MISRQPLALRLPFDPTVRPSLGTWRDSCTCNVELTITRVSVAESGQKAVDDWMSEEREFQVSHGQS